MEMNPVPTGARVALIEDNVPLREALVLFLRVKGWSVDTFGSGEESAGVVSWGEYAVVICDFSLPRENGLSVLRRVREASDKVVTVLITSYPGGGILGASRVGGSRPGPVQAVIHDGAGGIAGGPDRKPIRPKIDGTRIASMTPEGMDPCRVRGGSSGSRKSLT